MTPQNKFKYTLNAHIFVPPTASTAAATAGHGAAADHGYGTGRFDGSGVATQLKRLKHRICGRILIGLRFRDQQFTLW